MGLAASIGEGIMNVASGTYTNSQYVRVPLSRLPLSYLEDDPIVKYRNDDSRWEYPKKHPFICAYYRKQKVFGCMCGEDCWNNDPYYDMRIDEARRWGIDVTR